MKRALAGLVLAGCWTSAAPIATGPSDSMPSTERKPQPRARTPSTVKLEVVEDTESVLPDGTAVNVKHVMYAHLSDSKNLSSCTLVLARDGQVLELRLANQHGGSGPVVKDALGWKFSLVMADAYQQPSRVIVEATNP